MTCPSCASAVPQDARFCPNCGYALQQQVDERRIVTVLFGDLVGFTALAESLDPEQVKLLVDRCFDRLADDVVRFGGHIDKIVGDGILALFGAPVAHEDDAERAVRAGLQMQRTLAEVADELGAAVRMRIGINSGEVLVGALRVGGDVTAMGDVVNTAQRLQTIAEPGQVVVGLETYATTTEVFRYEPLGLLHARGREAPIDAWLAHEPLTAPGRQLRRLGTPLVGRDNERLLFSSAIATAFQRRRPTLLHVIGETGMGKSRIMREVITPLREREDVLFAPGRALPYGETNPWGPVADAVRSILGIASDDPGPVVRALLQASVTPLLGSTPDAPEVQRTVAGLLEVLGGEGQQTDVDPARARDEGARAARLYFEALASRQSFILALGDLQWAQPLVLEFIDALLDRVHRLPLVVVVTNRPELLDRWRPKPGRHNIVDCWLEPLDDEAADELLRLMLGRDPGPDVRRELVARSGGNPFFIEELSALLNDQGDLSSSYATVPATLRGVVAARIDALPPDERSLVEDLAVLGRAPRVAVAALAASRTSASGVQATLTRLADKQVLLLEDDSVEFTTDLLREVAYGTMSKAQRARRHADVAAWLEDVAGTAQASDDVLEEIARHYAAAADLVAELGEVDGVPAHVREMALATLQRAAQRADDRELYQVAARLFDQMVELLGDEPSAARRHALVGRARARTALHHLSQAEADLDAVEAEARAAGDEVPLARALVVRGDLLRNYGDFEGSVRVLDEAAAHWRHIGDRRGEASALRRIGWTHLMAGDADRAEPFIREAYDAFSEIGVKRGVAWAQQHLAWIAFLRGDVGVAESRLVESNRLFAAIGDWGGQSWGNAMLVMVMYAQGRTDDAEVLAERVAHEAREQGDGWSLGLMSVVLARVRLWQGRISEAIERSQETRHNFASIHDPWMEVRALPPLSDALTALGRLDEAEAVIQQCDELVQQFPESSDDRAVPNVMRLQRAMRLGDVPAGLVAFEALSGARPTVLGFEALPLARTLVSLQAGRLDEAWSAVGELDLPAPREPVGLRAARTLLLAVDGQLAEAEAQSAEVLQGAGMYYERLLAHLAVAAVAVRTGDAGRARRNIDEADREVSVTDDVVSAAVVSRARAVVLAAIGHGGAQEAALAADRKAAALGVSLAGWSSVLWAAVRASSEPAPA